MKRREELQARLEDTRFALLMDALAGELEREAGDLNRRLKTDAAETIPPDTDRRCREAIHRHFAKARRERAGKSVKKGLKALLLAAGIGAILLTAACAVSETARNMALRMVIEVFDTHTTFHFEPVVTPSPAEAASPEETEGPLEFFVHRLPEGYTLTEEGSDLAGPWKNYQGEKGETILIECVKTKNTGFNVDTEDAELEAVDINGLKGTFIKKDDVDQIIWTTLDNRYLFLLVAEGGADREELLELARQVFFEPPEPPVELSVG